MPSKTNHFDEEEVPNFDTPGIANLESAINNMQPKPAAYEPTNSNPEIAALETAINDMLPGLTTYVRDANLSLEIAALYKLGMIIREKTFTDASCRVGGMVTTHRFAILSNHMADFSEYEHGTNWGLHVAQRESRFKVLDVYEHEGKTQIALLHLLDDDRWHFFANADFDMPVLSTEEIRDRFEARCAQEPIPELATEQWLDRCSFPIGVSPAGDLFAPESQPAEAVWPVGQTDFRAFLDNVVFIFKGEDDEGKWLNAIPEDIEEGGIFAYGYIDQEEGLTFRYLCPATIIDGQWAVAESDKSILTILRAGALEKALWCPTWIGPEEFEPLTGEIDKNYAPDNPAVLELRDLDFMDEARHPHYPDDIQALLIKKDCGVEQVWLRLCDLRDDVIYGKLLNEPNQELGVHEGDVLPISFGRDDDGSLLSAVLLDEMND